MLTEHNASFPPTSPFLLSHSLFSGPGEYYSHIGGRNCFEQFYFWGYWNSASKCKLVRNVNHTVTYLSANGANYRACFGNLHFWFLLQMHKKEMRGNWRCFSFLRCSTGSGRGIAGHNSACEHHIQAAEKPKMCLVHKNYLCLHNSNDNKTKIMETPSVAPYLLPPLSLI